MTGQFTSGWYAQYVKLGKDGDATVLSNVRKALEYVNHVNDIRRGLGLGELAVTDSMMTNAILHADASAHTLRHVGGSNGSSENLIIGNGLDGDTADAYYNPTTSWYTSEMDFYNRLVDENKVPGLTKFEPGHITQAQWDANMALIANSRYFSNPETGEQVGHYLALVNPKWNVMGAGLNAGITFDQQANAWDLDGAGTNIFASDLTQESHHTVGEYRSMLDGYTGKLDAANKAYEDARKTTSDRQQALTRAQQTVTDAQARLAAAQQAVSDAQATVNARQADTDRAQGVYDTANNDHAAQQALDQATQDRDAAQSTLDTAQQALDQARSAQSTAEHDLSARQQDRTDAQQTLDQARQKLDRYQNALGNLDAANRQLAQATADAQRTADAYRTAHDAAQQADQALEQAKTRLDAANKDLADKQAALSKADTDANTTAQALQTAQARLDRLTHDADPATLTAAQQAVSDAQAAKTKADNDLSAAQAALDKATTDTQAAQSAYDEAKRKADKADADYNAAKTALDQANAIKAARQTQTVRATRAQADTTGHDDGTMTLAYDTNGDPLPVTGGDTIAAATIAATLVLSALGIETARRRRA